MQAETGVSLVPCRTWSIRGFQHRVVDISQQLQACPQRQSCLATSDDDCVMLQLWLLNVRPIAAIEHRPMHDSADAVVANAKGMALQFHQHGQNPLCFPTFATAVGSLFQSNECFARANFCFHIAPAFHNVVRKSLGIHWMLRYLHRGWHGKRRPVEQVLNLVVAFKRDDVPRACHHVPPKCTRKEQFICCTSMSGIEQQRNPAFQDGFGCCRGGCRCRRRITKSSQLQQSRWRREKGIREMSCVMNERKAVLQEASRHEGARCEGIQL
mmetsp:Transcript_27741/g.77736  ORF Transcript_27741/g.77736 Transcript_27741/m.77736 type:complete len:269 (+) Transcript_27741:2591-3397(+)